MRPKLRERYPILVFGGLLLVVLLVAGVQKLFTRAEVADFYPATCLGTWQNPGHAQGNPETFGGSSSTFSDANSAVFDAGAGEIFCGGFIPPDYEAKGEVKDINVTFIWRIEGIPPPVLPLPDSTENASSFEENAAASSTRAEEDLQSLEPSPPVVSSTSVSSTAIETGGNQPLEVSPPASSSAHSAVSSTSPISEPVEGAPTPNGSSSAPSGNPVPAETAPPPASEPPVQPEPSSAPVTPEPAAFFLNPFEFWSIARAQEISGDSSTIPVAETETAEIGGTTKTIETKETEEEAIETAETTKTASSTEEPTVIIVAPPLTAGLSPVAEASSSESIVAVASTTEEVVPPPAPDENFLSVRYSTDGETWTEIRRVHPLNWENLTISLPITSWEELAKLQIRVSGIPTKLQPFPRVLLDGILLGVQYELPPLLGKDKEQDQEKKPRKIFDPEAAHTCAVEPFAQAVEPGKAAEYTVALKPSGQGATARLDIGELPPGVSASFADLDSQATSAFLTLQTDKRTPAGSFNAVVIYEEVDSKLRVLANFCQLNLIIE